MVKFLANQQFLQHYFLIGFVLSAHFMLAQTAFFSSEGPKISCPETNMMNICAPIAAPLPMLFEDFNPSDDHTPTEEIEFSVDQQIEFSPDLTTVRHLYQFTDGDGNSNYCEMEYHIINRFLQAPVIKNQNQVCQNDFFRGLKIGSDNYMIYRDDNGQQGEMLAKCDEPSLLCTAENLGINASVAGNIKFWVTEFISFPDASVCESQATLLSLEVLEKPSATLTNTTHIAKASEVINLMEFVEDNTSGYWSGEGVYSTINADGSTSWLFSATGEEVAKLYYTVSNQFCSESYLLLIEPEVVDYTFAGVSVGLTINFNESQTIAIGNTTITFTAIEDSRCPKQPENANFSIDCEWEGEAIATLEISNDLGTVTETLKVDGYCFPDYFCFGESKEILGLNFWLTGIHPYPVGDNLDIFPNIDDDDYVVSLNVSSATSVVIDDNIDSPLIEDNTTQEEDQAILAATLVDIKAVTEGIPCENSAAWKFTSVNSICGNEYIIYPEQIDEVAFLESIQAYNAAFYEYAFKWNLYGTIHCTDEIHPIPISVICENGEAVLNYELVELEPEENQFTDAFIGFTLNYDETKTFAIGNTSIRFIDIEDNRCQTAFIDPNSTTIDCDWEGEATVTFEISNNMGTAVETFNVNGTCFPGRYGELKEILGLKLRPPSPKIDNQLIAIFLRK